MNYVTDTDSGSQVFNKETENNNAIKEMQEKLNELVLFMLIQVFTSTYNTFLYHNMIDLK